MSQQFQGVADAEMSAVPARPPKAYLNVAKRCNARCVYCNDWKTDKSPHVEFSVDVLAGVIDDLKDAGVRHVTLSGGEPLIRRDLWRIIDHVNEQGLTWSLITNGSMLNEANARRLLARGPTCINVSLDTLDRWRLREIRALRAEGILSNILGLQRLMLAEASPVLLCIIAVVSRTTIPGLLDLAGFCGRHEIGLCLQPMHASPDAGDDDRQALHWPLPEDIDRLELVLQALKADRGGAGRRLENTDAYLQAIPRFFREATYRPDSPCSAGAFDIVVDADLQVLPCWAMAPISTITPKHGLKAILQSDGYLRTRREIRRGNCPGCLYACHLNQQLEAS